MDEQGRVLGQRLIPIEDAKDESEECNYKFKVPEHSGVNLLVTFPAVDTGIIITKEAEFFIAGIRRNGESRATLWCKKIKREMFSHLLWISNSIKLD